MSSDHAQLPVRSAKLARVRDLFLQPAPAARVDVRALLTASPVVLAPMEDVSDAAFRRVCRTAGRLPGDGARSPIVCVTEFVHVDQILSGSKIARRKLALATEDGPTAAQIYGADPQRLLIAAGIAEAAAPAFIDINCGCWVPRIAGKGAGAGWLRDPAAMVAMARDVVAAVSLPVTVKTRIGWDTTQLPILDLVRRLEDVGVAAITIHCRTAVSGHSGPADWRWAARAREAVAIPIIVNGDVRTGEDAQRALAETGCAAAMIGRGAIDHPWAFREARALLAGIAIEPPTVAERCALYAAAVTHNVELRGERVGVPVSRRYLRLLGPIADAIRAPLFAAQHLAEVLAVLDIFLDETRRKHGPASNDPCPGPPSRSITAETAASTASSG